MVSVRLRARARAWPQLAELHRSLLRAAVQVGLEICSAARGGFTYGRGRGRGRSRGRGMGRVRVRVSVRVRVRGSCGGVYG